MNTRVYAAIATAAFFVTGLLGSSAIAATNMVVNVNGDPNIFECYLTATNLTVTLVTTNGATLVTNSNVKAIVYKDESNPSWPVGRGIPVPVIMLHTGQMVICHFRNALPTATVPEGASIHWHGIELDNDSDGTGVSQDSVLQDQTYLYQFIAPRPGLFWFHSHMMPGDATFAGMYGVIIITNASEGSLIPAVLPAPAYTYTLALSDIQFDTSGNVGKPYNNGTNTTTQTINNLAEICHQTGSPNSGNAACNAAGTPGVTVLVNGEVPLGAPGAQAPMYSVPNNKRIRLRLLNEAIARNFYIKLLDASGNQINLVRVGGQGGLLNNARLEGGIQTNANSCCDTGWNTLYPPGTIVIGSGDRVDVVAFVTGTVGSVVRLVGNPLNPPFQGNASLPTNYPVAFFTINGMNAGESALTNGTAILAATSETISNLSNLATNGLINPAPFGGTSDSTIHLTNSDSPTPTNLPSIENIDGGALDGNAGNGSFLTVPHLASSIYAHVGDVLQLFVKNETNAIHPFHLHGFSLQPISMIDSTSGNPLYTYSYLEFVDTVNVYPGQTLVFRASLDDRPKFCDQSPNSPPNPGPVLGPCTDAACGGAVGRWLFHCHIFLHAGVGMLSELVVLENNTALTNLSKSVQNPDTSNTGVDVLATAGTGSQMIADDFLCTSNGPITGIRIWGSWLNDIVDPNVTFDLRFWSDVPAGPGYSHPGTQLWREVFAPGSYSNSFYSPSSEQFLDPSQPGLFNTDTQVWQYDFSIPQCEAFYQSSGNVYWLSVTANTTNGLFGWKTCITNDYYGDDSTWSPYTFTNVVPWTDLHYPPGHPYQGVSMDQAFELDTAVLTNCLPPVAGFYYYPSSGTEPLTVNFNDASTGVVSNWFWDFGDGATAALTVPFASHTYTAGVYTVKLTVSGPCGSNTVIETNAIGVASCHPSASFTAYPTTGDAPLDVFFTDMSTGTITNWFWTFGDGSTTNVTSPSVDHTYTTTGVFTVSLFVNGPCGFSSVTQPNYITVTGCPPPMASFVAYPTNGVEPLFVNFYDASTGAVTNWFWNFGDGSTTNINTTYVSHTYSAGVYTVTLTVSGLCGAGSTNALNCITVLSAFQGWQTYYFGSTNNPNGAPGADPDHDGFSNLQEYLAGFNPTNSGSYPHIIRIVRTGNDITVTYLGANGDYNYMPGIFSRTNVLEFTRGTANRSYSNNFTSTGQTNILSGGDGTGIVTNMVDPGGATNRPSRYYRIHILTP